MLSMCALQLARVGAREEALAEKERTQYEKEIALQTKHEELTTYEQERAWDHWQKDSMRKLLTEIERKVGQSYRRMLLSRCERHTLPAIAPSQNVPCA